MNKGKTKAASAKISRAEATHKALEMKKAGVSYRVIADRLGLAPSTVHKYIHAELDRLNEQNTELADSYRALMLARYEAILTPVYQKAIAGDQGAVEKTRRVLDSIADLTGIKAPKKIAPTTPDGSSSWQPEALTPEERRKRIAELEKKLGRR